MAEDLFNPFAWQNWALVFAVLIGAGWGIVVASLEDQRREKVARQSPAQKSAQKSAQKLAQKSAQKSTQAAPAIGRRRGQSDRLASRTTATSPASRAAQAAATSEEPTRRRRRSRQPLPPQALPPARSAARGRG